MQKAIAHVTGRSYNPWNFYLDIDLLVQSVVSTLHGLGRPEDSLIFRCDPAFQLGLKKVASPATICRWINRVGTECEEEIDRSQTDSLAKYDSLRIGSETFDIFNQALLSHCLSKIGREEKIIIDADSTFIETFGEQKQSAFCGKNRAKGYFPLMVFINGRVAHIQNAPAATDGRRLLEQCLEKILRTLRERFPQSAVLVRADGGFNSNELFEICERHQTAFLSGLGPNNQLNSLTLKQIRDELLDDRNDDILVQMSLQLRNELFFTTPLGRTVLRDKGNLERICGPVKCYQAPSWRQERRIYYRIQDSAEHQEVDLRYVQTNMSEQEILLWADGLGLDKQFTKPKNCPSGELAGMTAIELYDGLYCQRAVCELAIKDFKALLSSLSLSHQNFFSNWFRLILVALCAHILADLKNIAFHQTGWAKCGFHKLFKTLLSIPAVLTYRGRRLEVGINQLHHEYMDAYLKLIRACS